MHLNAFLALALAVVRAAADDQPQWGHAWSRNMVSTETGLPAEFDPATGKNIRWVADLGTESHSTPVIADGKVYIGTNNGNPRNPAHQGDRGVLMCFAEADGKFLWQLVVPKLSEDPYLDWPNSGISSPATVDGGRVYIVSNRGEVLCLDPEGLKNGNDGPYRDEATHHTPKGTNQITLASTDADILWLFDMVADAGIWTHDGAHSSILVHGDFLYVNTGTGVDNTHRKIRTPDAPSLIVLHKKTGRLLAREREGIAPNIFHATWASPSMAEINGQPVILFAAGNGMVYGFEPLQNAPAEGEVATLKKLWEYDLDPAAPKTDVHRFTSNRREGPSNVYGMPVYHDGRLYVTGGGDLWWGKNEAFLHCVEIKNSNPPALLWKYPLVRHTMSTPAIADKLIFVSDTARNLHCIDRASGQGLWTHELGGETWASPYLADGKVYIGTRRGDFWTFAADPEKKVISYQKLSAPISATAVAANGVLYVATMKELFALKEEK